MSPRSGYDINKVVEMLNNVRIRACRKTYSAPRC